MSDRERVIEVLCLVEAMREHFADLATSMPTDDLYTLGYREGFIESSGGAIQMLRHALYTEVSP